MGGLDEELPGLRAVLEAAQANAAQQALVASDEPQNKDSRQGRKAEKHRKPRTSKTPPNPCPQQPFTRQG